MKKSDRLKPKKKREYRAQRRFDLLMFSWQRKALLEAYGDVPSQVRVNVPKGSN